VLLRTYEMETLDKPERVINPLQQGDGEHITRAQRSGSNAVKQQKYGQGGGGLKRGVSGGNDLKDIDL
jgi:hypothetical protein